MTYADLIEDIVTQLYYATDKMPWRALRDVVGLHMPDKQGGCIECWNQEWQVSRYDYPCPTIQSIIKELDCNCFNRDGNCKMCSDAQKKELK